MKNSYKECDAWKTNQTERAREWEVIPWIEGVYVVLERADGLLCLLLMRILVKNVKINMLYAILLLYCFVW